MQSYTNYDCHNLYGTKVDIDYEYEYEIMIPTLYTDISCGNQLETLIKEVIFIFHCRQYSSSVLYYVSTTSVVAGIGGTVGGDPVGEDDTAIDIGTIGVAIYLQDYFYKWNISLYKMLRMY